MSETFDPIATSRQLHRAGIQRPHAEAVADAIHDSRQGLATEAGLDALRSETKTGMDALSSRIDGVNGRIDGVIGLIDGVNGRIDGVIGLIDGVKDLIAGNGKRIDGVKDLIAGNGKRIDAVNERIEALRGDLSTVRWVLGLIAAMVMALLVIMLTQTF